MTKEKWYDVFEEVRENTESYLFNNFEDVTPENWLQVKTAYLNMFNELDKATEVYFMENKGV